MILAGIDGCRAGWLCVVEHDSRLDLHIAPALEPWLEQWCPDVAVIDMPIGLPDAGPRRCDTLARQALRPARASSLFPAPVRGALHLPCYASTCAAHRDIDGRALSKQTWFLLPRIREIDELLGAPSRWRGVLREGHPELSFATWNDDVPMTHAKRTAAGAAERRRRVDACWPGAVEAGRTTLPRGGWQENDLLDALAVLWTARRVAAGKAIRRPDPPDHDATGLAMAIVS